MSSNLLIRKEKVIACIKEECLKENIDISSLVLTGDYSEKFNGDLTTGAIEEQYKINIANKETVKLENSDKYVKLGSVQSKISTDLLSTHNTRISLTPEMRNGDDYLPIKAFRFDGDEEVTLRFENGVTVINYNMLLPDDYLDEYNESLSIIEKNLNKWNGKVKFLSTFLCDSYEKKSRIQFIEENNLNKFPEVLEYFYTIQENPFCIIYGLGYCNFSVILDQNGVIKFVGSTKNKDVEGLINQLVDGKEITEVIALPLNADFVQRFEAFKEEASNLFKEIRSDETKKANYNMNFKIESSGKFNCNLDKAAVENKQTFTVNFEISLRDGEYHLFHTLLRKYFSEEEIESNKFILNRMETFDLEVPEKKVCSACQGVIPKEDLTYCCPECKIFFCAQCVNAREGKNGFEALVHRDHYLLVFKNPLPEYLLNLDKARLGENLFAQMDEDELDRYHDGIICNRASEGCKKESHDYQERFICMNCRPGALSNKGHFDFCRSCFHSNCNTGPDIVREDGHKNNHVYLSLYYAGDDYDKY